MADKTKPMKILQILPELNHGGIELCVVENAESLVKHGHESHIISSGGRLVTGIEAAGSIHHTLPIAPKRPRVLCQIKPLRKLIEAINPDVLHIHSRLQAWLCWFALKKIKHRPKVITNVHGFNSISFYSKKLLFGDATVIESESVKAYVLKNYTGIDEERIHVIPLGVDTERFNRTPPNHSAINARLIDLDPDFQNAKILMLPGRITRIKGHQFLIDLMARLKSEGLNIKALIVGGSSESGMRYFNELITMISKSHLDDTIYFYGNCDDMVAMYQRIDISLSLTTQPESYGRTILEALACGTPVVGFNHGGVAENLAKYFPEGRVTPNNGEDLYQKVREVLAASNVIIPEITDSIDDGQRQLLELYQSLSAK